jgi:hypothetical protein
MPVESMIFIVAVIAAFTTFGITLAWAHRRAH